jgi:DNA repair protein RadC
VITHARLALAHRFSALIGCEKRVVSHDGISKAATLTTGKAIMNMQVRNEESPPYVVTRDNDGDEVIRQALSILLSRMKTRGVEINSPQALRDYLTLSLADLKHEEFHVLFLDARHRVISAGSMFRGTLMETSVYPREVVKASLQHNAASVIFAHCHPSGYAKPSTSDRMLTDRLKNALSMVDIKVLDHCVVGGVDFYSFAENGEI